MNLRAALTALAALACSVETRVSTAANAVSLAHADVPSVEVHEAWRRASAGEVVLVDVREPREVAVSRLHGAVTLERYEAEFPGRPAVLYCTIGERSAQVVARLRARGVPATNLHGSALAWVHAGLPLVDDQGRPTRRLHTWSSSWALVPDGIEAVWD